VFACNRVHASVSSSIRCIGTLAQREHVAYWWWKYWTNVF